MSLSRPYSSTSMRSQGSAHSSETAASDRILIQATLDNEQFSVVIVSRQDTGLRIREKILQKLQLPYTDASLWGLVRTEIGESDLAHSPLIDDDTLLALCLQLGDDKGTIKFRIQPPADDLSSYRRSDIPRFGAAPTPHGRSSMDRITPRIMHEALGKTPWLASPTTGRRPPAAWPSPVMMAHSPSPVQTPLPPGMPMSTTLPELHPGHIVPPALSSRASDEWVPISSSNSTGAPPSLQPAHPAHRYVPRASNKSSQATMSRPRHASDTSETLPRFTMMDGDPVTRLSLPAQSSLLQRRSVLSPPNGAAEAKLRQWVYPTSSSGANAPGPSGRSADSPQRSMIVPEEHSLFPLFKGGSGDNATSPNLRPLPIVPSPTSSASSPGRPEQRPSMEQEAHSRVPSSDHDEGTASIQRLMAHVRMSEDRGESFDTFSDDTLGGTFAQPLDASTLTMRTPTADSVAHRAREERPVLTVNTSPAGTLVPEKPTTWAFRPPAEKLYEQLDSLFPRHDLDRPLFDAVSPQPVETPSGRTWTAGDALPRQGVAVAMPRKAPRPLQRDSHSIRVIAQNRRRLLESTNFEARRQVLRKEEVLRRRRSTKLWGGRMIEMRTNGAESEGVVPANKSGEEPAQRPVFKWVKGDLIGKGTYGRVYLALNATAGEMIAVKQVELPRTAADRDSSRQQSIVAALKSEIDTLRVLDHPNVVTCLGFEETADTLSIFLEYVSGGSIGSCLRRHGKLEEDTTSSFLNQTLQGLAYLHKQGILHRDLKADNLLVDHHGTCKISDFGTVRRSEDIYANVENMSMQGSIFWMAPEVVSLSRKGYSAKVDIWSLGCVVLEMLAGRRPWSNEEAVQAMFKIGAERRAPPVPPDVTLSKPAAHFLRNCFEIDPDKRPTASRLLEHVYAWPSPDWRFENSPLYQALFQSPPPPPPSAPRADS
ncbi:mitogen-activated protein kinase kinase kinase [Malassezia equina]|uniref:Mitogen-activated protein kinase kinase kinase n=1 Tax=Malassezia equina TaxID=1381935 RepID=A0AAF0EHR5_9BASI|nr:mitogen-activated protein kinase kinase kinase [Malassezia equina]